MSDNREISRQANSLKQFVKFSCVGVSNALVSYLIYIFAMLVLSACFADVEKKYLLAQLLSFILSVAWSFFWNERYVFSSRTDSKKHRFMALIKAYISYSFTGLFLNGILLVLWIDCLGISEFASPVINMVINVPISFLINKYWVYGVKKNNN